MGLSTLAGDMGCSHAPVLDRPRLVGRNCATAQRYIATVDPAQATHVDVMAAVDLPFASQSCVVGLASFGSATILML